VRHGPAVHDHLVLRIAADTGAPTEHIEDTRPAMRVNRSPAAGQNPGLKHAHDVTFEQQRVVVGRGDECVKRLRPDVIVQSGCHVIKAILTVIFPINKILIVNSQEDSFV
jgi:hypothetical protein